MADDIKEVTAETQKQEDTNFLKTVRDVAFVLAVYMYFTGWSYVYNYYDYFNLSIRQVDIDFYYILIYAVNVMIYLVTQHWAILIVSFIVTGVLLKIIPGSWESYITGFSMFVALYFLSYKAATSDARTAFDYNASKLKTIEIAFSEGEKKPGAPVDTKNATQLFADSLGTQFANYNKSDYLRLLASTKESYFVLYADSSVHDSIGRTTARQVFEIKKDKVAFVKITN